MSVAKKQRRKLVREGRAFVWWVAEDYDSTDSVLHVVSDDKSFVVYYVLGQADANRLLVVLGREFAGAVTGGPWTRFRCPCFDVHGVMLPSGVRRLIDWCLILEGERQPLEYGAYPCSFYGAPPDVAAYSGSHGRDAIS